MAQIEELLKMAESRKEEMAEDMMEMSRIPSVNPRMGGEGEYQRMQWIQSYLKKHEIDYERIEVPDNAVKEGVRQNLIVRLPGSEETARTLWFVAHADTVNTGNLSYWKTDPFQPVREGDRIYGLGVEDNSQAVITALYTCRLIKETGFKTKVNLGFMFVSDEETGSTYGLRALVNRGVFSEEDEAIVSDAGSSDGSFVEIAEKSQVWLKFTVTGKTSHAAMPQLGINAASAGMHLAVEIEDMLKREFDQQDSLFNPPYSTFELTQKFDNVDSPNVLPGKDAFVMDMRVLPCYTVDAVMEKIEALMRKCERERNVSVTVEFLNRVDAPDPTPADSDVVCRLVNALRENGVEAVCGGIGGGTCGAVLREIHVPAVVWSTLDELAHQPNEYVVISNMVKDIRAYLATIGQYA